MNMKGWTAPTHIETMPSVGFTSGILDIERMTLTPDISKTIKIGNIDGTWQKMYVERILAKVIGRKRNVTIDVKTNLEHGRFQIWLWNIIVRGLICCAMMEQGFSC